MPMKVFRKPYFPRLLPPLNPYAQAVVCTGACGFEDSGLHVFTSYPSSVTFNNLLVRNSGPSTILVDTTAAPGSFGIMAPFAPANLWRSITQRFYLYFETLPDNNTRIATFTTVAGGISLNMNGLVYRPSTGKLEWCEWGSFFNSYTFAGLAGKTISTGQWYRFDMRLRRRVADGFLVLDAQMDGDPFPEYAFTGGNNFIANPTFGDHNNRTQKWRWADYYGINGDDQYTPATYPIGAGHVRRYVPTADGTHNTGAAGSFIVGAAGANITDATTTSYLLIDDIPIDDATPDTDDYITQTNDSGGGALYVEHSFGNPDGYTPVENPRALDALIAYHQENTNTGNCKFYLNDNGTLAIIKNFSGAGQTSTRYAVVHFNNPPTGLSGWRLSGLSGNFELLKHRFGYSTDGNPNQSLDGIMIEAEFPE